MGRLDLPDPIRDEGGANFDRRRETRRRSEVKWIGGSQPSLIDALNESEESNPSQPPYEPTKFDDSGNLPGELDYSDPKVIAAFTAGTDHFRDLWKDAEARQDALIDQWADMKSSVAFMNGTIDYYKDQVEWYERKFPDLVFDIAVLKERLKFWHTLAWVTPLVALALWSLSWFLTGAPF